MLVIQSCLTLCDPMDSSVHGILQARILEWVTIPFSRGSSQLRDWTSVFHIAGRFFTVWAIREKSMDQCYILLGNIPFLVSFQTSFKACFYRTACRVLLYSHLSFIQFFAGPFTQQILSARMCWELPEALGYSTEQGAEALIFGVSIPVLGVKRKKVEKEGARRVWGCRDFKQTGYNRPWEGRLRVKSWRNEQVNLPEHRASPREVRGPWGRRVQEAVWLEQSGGLGQRERKRELQGGWSPVWTLPAMAVCRGGWHLAAGGCWRLPAMQRGQGRTKSGAAVRTPALGAGVLSSWILDLFWGQAYRISDQ